MNDSAKKTGEERFAEIVESYGRFLRHVIIRLCPKDLGLQFEDIEQEARIKLWRALENERDIKNPASYLYRIAATTTIDAIRKARRRREEQLDLLSGEGGDGQIPDFLPADASETPERILERTELIRIAATALANVPAERRRAAGLYLQGFSSTEIGELLGWTEAKSRNLLYRGLKDLRDNLKSGGIDYQD